MLELSKYCITMTTLVTPYMERSVGRFCNWFNTDPTKEISKFRSLANVQFDNEEIIPLSDTYLMDTDRSEFDYSNFPLELSQSHIDFVFFGAEQNCRGKSFWDFVLSENKLNEIEANSKQGKRIQIFDLCFDNYKQRDPNLSVSSPKEIHGELLFKTKCTSTIGLGVIKRHLSMSIKQYQKLTGVDPILQFAQKTYYDQSNYDPYRKGTAFEDYLEQQRNKFG
jgi:hypothetical protein